MRKFTVALMCLGMFAAVAHAQGGSDLELYFSTTGAGDVVPPEYAAYENPTISAGTFYLWAFVLTDDLWNGLALENQGALAIGGQMYNDPIPVLGNIRWEPAPASDLDPTDDQYIFGFSVQQMGLGSATEATGDAYFGWDYFIPGTNHAGTEGGHYLVAEYQFDSLDEVFLAPGIGGISLSGSGPGENDVYFGFNADGTDRDAPVADNAVGIPSAVADIVPEPASLLLLALAGLALRRR